MVAGREDMPARCDFGRYVNCESNFAVRFYFYLMVLHEGKMMPLQVPVITVTLQDTGCQLSPFV
jgi:hypothetical protein